MYETYRKNDLYIVKAEVDLKTKASVEANFTLINDNDVWHRRFYHVSNGTIEKFVTHNKVRELNNTKIDKYNCDVCIIGKSTKSSCKRIKYSIGRAKTFVNYIRIFAIQCLSNL